MVMTVCAKDKDGVEVIGTLAGGGPGVARLTHVTRGIDPRKPWELTAEVEEELVVDASTVEVLC